MKIEQIGAFEAKTRLSELLEHVRLGRVYRITRRGRAIAELRPIAADEADRLRFGCDRGRVVVKDDFDAPIPGFEPYRR
jgi:prevent-host-death family protein